MSKFTEDRGLPHNISRRRAFGSLRRGAAPLHGCTESLAMPPCAQCCPSRRGLTVETPPCGNRCLRGSDPGPEPLLHRTGYV